MSKTQKQIVGNLGEGIVCNHLKNKGFEIIERNYWKPWGEIDIIAKKKDKLYFIEVKTVKKKESEDVSCVTKNKVTHETKNCILCNKNLGFNKNNKKDSQKKLFSFIRKNEAKNVSHETKYEQYNVIHETNREVINRISLRKIRKVRDLNNYRPEDNLHPWKLKRLSRVIQTYLIEKNNNKVSHVTFQDEEYINWQFDVAIVYLNTKQKEAEIKYLKDIIL